MSQIFNHAVLTILLLSNVSTALASNLELAKSIQKSLPNIDGYSEKLLDWTLQPTNSTFKIAIGGWWIPKIRIPPIRPRVVRPPVPATSTKIPIKSKPNSVKIQKKNTPISPPHDILLNPYLQVDILIDSAISKSKQQKMVKRLLDRMSQKNSNILQQRISHDIKLKINSQHSLLSDENIQAMTNQCFREASDAYYPAYKEAHKLLKNRKSMNVKLNNQDKKDAESAAKKVVEKQLNDKQHKSVLTARTISIVAGIAVTAAILDVENDDDK